MFGILLACSVDPEPAPAPVVEPTPMQPTAYWSGTLPPGGEQPDILLISVDCMRADALTAAGYTRDATPNLDALADRGVRFANARSVSAWTLPSHASMLTGLSPQQHGVVDKTGTLEGARMVQHALGEQGYRTASFTTVTFVGPQYGFDGGFDHVETFGLTHFKGAFEGTDQDAEHVVDATLTWWEQQEGQSVFAFVHFFDLHTPYEAPNGLDAHFDRPGEKGESYYGTWGWYQNNPLDDDALAHQRAQYDEELYYLDQQLGRLFAALEDRNVVIVVTSDHGEEFGEHGGWGHAHQLYPEVVNVPLIVAGAGDPHVIQTLVSTQSIAATLAQLGGAEMPGVSLVPSLSGVEPEARPLVLSTSRAKTNKMAVLDGDDAFYWDLREGTWSSTDPARDEEWKALAAASLGTPWASDHPVDVTEGVAVLGTQLSAQGQGRFAVAPADARVGEWSQYDPPPAGAPVRYDGPVTRSIELDEEDVKLLEALGYVE